MVASSVPADRLFRQIDVDLFDVEIFLDAPFAELAADAALLVAAPRRLDVGRLHVVDPDDAGAQVLDDAHGAEDVARPDRRGQTVEGVVGDPQRVRLGVERDHAGDRPEDFLARDARAVVDVVEDRRLDEVALVERTAGGAAAARRHLRFLLADLLVVADAIELLAADDRAHLRLAI